MDQEVAWGESCFICGIVRFQIVAKRPVQIDYALFIEFHGDQRGAQHFGEGCQVEKGLDAQRLGSGLERGVAKSAAIERGALLAKGEDCSRDEILVDGPIQSAVDSRRIDHRISFLSICSVLLHGRRFSAPRLDIRSWLQ